MKSIIRYPLMLLCLCLCLYSLYEIYQIVSQNITEKQQLQELQELAGLSAEPDPSPADDQSEPKPAVQPDFEALRAVNPDICGWVYIPDTEINYPLVQGSDNDYYLTHTAMKQENYAGAVFLDYRNANDFSDDHTLVYAHNVKHGTMFAQLEYFMEEAFFQSHPIVYLYTPQADYEAHVYAFYTTTDSSDAYQLAFRNAQEKLSYAANWTSQSSYHHDVEVRAEDHLVTFSTCSYERNNQPSELRHVLKCVLKKVD